MRHTCLNGTLTVIGKSNGLCVCQVLDHVLCNCNKYTQHRQQRREREAENRIENILQEEGMQSDRVRFIFLYDTDFIKRI